MLKVCHFLLVVNKNYDKIFVIYRKSEDFTMREPFVNLILYISVGVILGVVIMTIISKMGLNKNQQKADLIIKEANIEAENVKRQAVLDGKNAAYELKLQAEKEIKKQRQEVTELENKLIRRDDSLNFREEKLQNKEKSLDDRLERVKNKTAEIDKMRNDLQHKIDIQITELERVANLTALALVSSSCSFI